MAQIGETQIEQMIDLCEKMLDKSYCVYSNFPVAAALITEDGTVFSGCNVENSSYGLAICAERTAAVKAVSEGHRKFKACFVRTRSDRAIGPCGACRQFLYEFGPDMTIYLIKSNRQYIKTNLKELLPLGFDQNELNSGVTK